MILKKQDVTNSLHIKFPAGWLNFPNYSYTCYCKGYLSVLSSYINPSGFLVNQLMLPAGFTRALMLNAEI